MSEKIRELQFNNVPITWLVILEINYILARVLFLRQSIIIAKVNYFIDYWRDFLYSESIEEDLAHTVIYNPRELFQEFADEISRKEFKNKDNKDFFVKSINKIYDFDIESTKFLKSTLLLIKHQFNNPDFQYLLHLLSIVDRKLSNNQLGYNCIEELEKILTDDTELNSINKEKIQILVKFIIFEFINKEYSIKSIEKFAYNIFDKYRIERDGILLCTSFPHNCKVSFATKIDSIEFKKYQEQIREIIDNLDLSKRLLSLKNYLTNEPEKLTYIFQIKGLKGNIDSRFGNVRIYNPETIQLIQNYPDGLNLFDELFNSKDLVYCNGAVTLEVVDNEYAKKKAALLLTKVLDILLVEYYKYKLPIVINTTKILICDENGNQRAMSDSSDSDTLYHHKSIDAEQLFNTEYLINYYDSILINKLKVDYIILESLH